ncbi:methyltransferase family protein [Mariniflexile fucanivorans]|uniref:Methyltransferase family protein n=1 Tax=Mariniflexile fucanivorans TaxID=264023 RepID=A0A4R1RQV9_9FLAO|nr:class I SAM-dependent methyltransferase [Mariniflexile fucanivorans]TCL68811.1 methyltransferase family protein [Mariniflexile fucanivorans]
MTEKIKFEEEDVSGAITLDIISKADKFNQWMYQTIKPFCKGQILEIGSGIGNISNFFIKDNYDIFLSDIRASYCLELEKKFNAFQNFLGAEIIDLTDPDFDKKYAKHLQKYDTVFALNVVEHIYEDELAIQNCHKLLTENGNAIILVPSYQSLFNQFDGELGHYRRYNKASLTNVFSKSNFELIHKQYFNFIGIFGWYISGKILNKKTIPKEQMKLYNTLVPVIKIIDKSIFNTMGLSTIIVGKKTL